MPHVTFITFAGTRHEVDVPTGTTLMRAAVDHGVPGIDGDCGGNCACATCHVYIDSPWAERLSPKSDAEDDMLGLAVDPRPTSRLACQIRLSDALDGIVVALPEGQH
ncbi:MAG TPA: 2Fe-2S iron-sulfur cluster-binding protein [Burkholderiaceae bacterium]|nr:2Fe-2S iron-sulfur cluster-binding protein [Burkholderiaceae bacterium]